MSVISKELRKGRTLGLVLFFIFLTPLTLFAEGKEIKGPSRWAIGVGTGWLSDYPGAAQGRVRFLPFPVFRGDLLRLDRIEGMSGDLAKNSRFDFSWNFIFQFPTNSSSIPVRTGMPNLDWLLSLGPQMKYYIFRGSRHRTFFRFPIRFNTCTNFSTRTQFCGVAFNPGFRHAWFLGPLGEITFRWETFTNTSEYQQYFYEVNPRYATADRPAFHARAGFTGFVYGMFHSIPFDGWSFSTSANIYDYSWAINQDSPLFVHKTNYALFLAFTFDIDS